MYRFFIKGIVQGVGFRPYIYRKAKEYHLVGYVKNIGSGVEVIVDDKEFIRKLTDLPALARITGHTVEEIDTKEAYHDFSIINSTTSEGETILPADIFMCEDCLKELRQKDNRRHDYYFITCTSCGPRFSMIEDYPYDRIYTAMKDFDMCEECKIEYTNPLDRRYHAQTIACKDCGPKLKLISDGKHVQTGSDLETIKEAMNLLKLSEVISIKGIGGFHICSLSDDGSVKKVRNMLKRKHKPFALMVKDMDMARRIAHISSKEEELLKGYQRPIVILEKKDKDSFRETSELDSIGIMLPYTSLHHLLFDFIDEPLVMTSCNFPGEPVSIREAITKHSLSHEREIINRCDDSVIKVIDNNLSYLRRSRGYTPIPVSLPIEAKDTIAVGAELNNVICTAKKNNCFLSQYVGNTSKLATSDFMRSTIDTFINLTRLNPEIIACDLHPSYSSTLLAKELAKKYDAKLIQIQHHKAHVASVAAEHNLSEYMGIAMDGLGYGEDDTIWGGEIFEAKNNNLKRIGHLELLPQLGGDTATIYPKKMLFGALSKFMDEKEIINLKLFDEKESHSYFKQVQEGFNAPLTSSAGRVLDAVSALLGICEHRTYDGRPAMLLESHATTPLKLEPVIKNNILSTSVLFQFLLENKDKDTGALAATAQIYLAEGLYMIAEESAKGKSIVLSGGVAYNSMISSYMLKKEVLMNKEIPSGDGGICYGQAYLANICK